ncbi:MAG: MFS transporter [Reichenbachiella sp.]
MIIPELPSYLTSLGGGEHKGLIIALFTLTAGLSRPLSGKLADKVGRIPVMVVGASVSGIAALLYPIASTVFGFFFLRFFHGFSTGFKPTGTSAYVADIIPWNRRGEAMGYVGFFGSLGMAFGPSIGPLIAKHYSLNAMFFCSSAFAISSVLILVGMKESLNNPKRLSFSHFNIKSSEIFEPKVIAPSIVMILTVFSFGVVLTIIPDLSDHLNISNRGLFFTYFTLASLLVRILAGKASDKYGRVPVLRIGCLAVSVALLIIANAHSHFSFALAAIVFGIGVGICSPTVFAWTIDLSHEEHRGRAIATMYIALEIGIGIGALVSGWVYNNQIERIPLTFYIPSLFALAGFIYLYSNQVKSVMAKNQSNER